MFREERITGKIVYWIFLIIAILAVITGIVYPIYMIINHPGHLGKMILLGVLLFLCGFVCFMLGNLLRGFFYAWYNE